LRCAPVPCEAVSRAATARPRRFPGETRGEIALSPPAPNAHTRTFPRIAQATVHAGRERWTRTREAIRPAELLLRRRVTRSARPTPGRSPGSSRSRRPWCPAPARRWRMPAKRTQRRRGGRRPPRARAATPSRKRSAGTYVTRRCGVLETRSSLPRRASRASPGLLPIPNLSQTDTRDALAQIRAGLPLSAATFRNSPRRPTPPPSRPDDE
jgi:hypothetical protein